MKKRILLCADDYGQALPISEAIIELVSKRRLSATSCMVNGSEWEKHAEWLLPFKSHIHIGLHFNLTEGVPLSEVYQKHHGPHFGGLSRLLVKSVSRQIDQKIIESECEAQINRFLEVMGFLPHFIDGHQHIHQFPVIKDALIAVYLNRLREKNAYIRLVQPNIHLKDLSALPKKIVITLFGAIGLKRLLNQHGIPHNTSFSGIYAFRDANHYQKFFTIFLDEIKQEGLIMCHPGQPTESSLDPIAKARAQEYLFLGSDSFLEICQQHNVVI